MALDPKVKDLLNKFADTQIALRLPNQPLSKSNPMLGDAINAALIAATAAGATASYTPAVTANWTGADPTTVQGALDRLAAALGPIA